MIYLVIVLMALTGEFSADAISFESIKECEAKRVEVAERIKTEAETLKEMGVKVVSLRCEKV